MHINYRDDELKKYLKNKKVAVLGLGRSGISAVEALLKFEAIVFISEADKNAASSDSFKKINQIKRKYPLIKINHEFGTHSEKILDNDLIIVSPGVPFDHPVIKKAIKNGLPVWSELELGYRLTQFKHIAAVTGTNGKTTTVSLLGDMCMRDGKKTLVAGNIGNPLCNAVFSKIVFDMLVLEVSSYQLESIDSFHPNVSVILNLTNDHLARHKTMRNYAAAKERVFLNQTEKDFSILNADDPWCKSMENKTRAKVILFSERPMKMESVFYDNKIKKIIALFPSQSIEFPLPTHLPGLHNISNSCAAIACALKLNLSLKSIRASLMKFKGVEHRIEKVKIVRGITYINDSKGTNVDSTLKAIESFSEPMLLILGGQDKGGSYLPIKSIIHKINRSKERNKARIKGILLIGEASEKIFAELKGECDIFFCKTVKNAVKESYKRAVRGDIILFSPACASFDQFKNFEDRGKQFKQFVKDLQ